MYIDPDWASCVLAMHMDTDFTDEKGHVVTPGGTAVIGTTIKKFGGGAADLSSALNTNNDLTGIWVVPSGGGSEFTLGTGDFTFEAWIYPTYIAGNNKTIFSLGDQVAINSTFELFAIQYDATTWKLGFYNGQLTARLIHTVRPSINQWTHVAVTRASGVTRIFINGTVHTSTYADTSNYIAPYFGRIGIGKMADGGTYGAYRFIGHMDDVYLYKGVAKYTATFTPPTEPRGVLDRKITGFVKDMGNNPLARTVRAYARNTGALVGETVSSAVDGSYEIQMIERTELSVVMLDDDAGTLEKDLVIRTTPVVL